MKHPLPHVLRCNQDEATLGAHCLRGCFPLSVGETKSWLHRTPHPARVRQRSSGPLPDALRCPPLGSATEREFWDYSVSLWLLKMDDFEHLSHHWYAKSGTEICTQPLLQLRMWRLKEVVPFAHSQGGLKQDSRPSTPEFQKH